jgi:hypothetical protein
LWTCQIGVCHGEDFIVGQLRERSVYLGKLPRAEVLFFIWGGGQWELNITQCTHWMLMSWGARST